MTFEEKRRLVIDYCREHELGCGNCPMKEIKGVWCATYNSSNVPEFALDEAIEHIAAIRGSAVNHPSHYNQGGIECIDAMVSAFGKDKVADWSMLNAFKYIWRYDHKNGTEDIDKAIWYLNKYKELKEGANEELT